MVELSQSVGEKMDRRVHIPVNVRPGSNRPAAAPEVENPAAYIVSDAQAPVTELQEAGRLPAGPQELPGDGERGAAAQAEENEWRDRALRLQAEMDNFRKRQKRLAQDEIQAERERLLRSFLRVVDDLDRALTAPVVDGQGLRAGVQLTRRSALQLLQREGVEPIEGRGQAFDPNWHEAVTTVDHRRAGVEPDTIVEVLEPGYRQQSQLLRPAKVVVAV